jgi:cell division septation protein DedD
MAFEPRRSIAGIMTAYGGQKWQSPLASAFSGYMKGKESARQDDLMAMREKQLSQAEADRLVEDIGGKATAIHMMPEQDRPFAWAEFRNNIVNKHGQDPGEYSEEMLREIMADSKVGMRQLQSEQQLQQQQSQFGKPFEAVNKQGRRVFVERAPDGTVREIEGYTAPLASSLMDTPAKLQIYNAYADMTPEQQALFQEANRAQQTMNLGGTQAVLGPGGTVQAQYPVTPKPEQMPAFQAEQVAAKDHEANRQKWFAVNSKLSSAIDAGEGRSKVIEANINRAKNLISAKTTQYGAALANWPATDARALRNVLDTIRANVGFSELQGMRDMSPTGGALGQVSEFENRLLQSVLGPLDQYDQADNLLLTLDSVLAERQASVKRLKAAFTADQARYSQPYQPPVQQPAPAPAQAPPPQAAPQPQPAPEYTNYGPRTGGPRTGGPRFLGFE